MSQAPLRCATCGGRFPCLPCTMAAVRAALRAPKPRKRVVARPPTTLREGPSEVQGISLGRWLDLMISLPALGGPEGSLAKRRPALHLRRAQAQPKRRLAFASYERHLISVTVWPGMPPHEALGSLLHECVHLASPTLRHHDRFFRRTLALAAEQAFGIDVHAASHGATWALDQAIVAALATQPAQHWASPPR